MDILRKVSMVFIGFFLLFNGLAYAGYSNGKILTVRTGDVILLPLDCYSCAAIADEEQSEFSHSGVVILDENDEAWVAESLSKVKLVPLKDFLARVAKGKNAVAYRAHELDLLYLYGATGSEFDSFKARAREVFATKFRGLPFDRDFLWDNFNEQGQEKLYCSEFIAKFLNNFLRVKIQPYAMDFLRNWDFWLGYFNGNIPQGKLGNSPASFSRSNLFYQVRIFQ